LLTGWLKFVFGDGDFGSLGTRGKEMRSAKKKKELQFAQKTTCRTERGPEMDVHKKGVDGRIRTYAGETHMISSHAQ
jgi:hypothetical protein